MKKIFSFFAAILFAGSMMAATTTYQHIFTTKPALGTITLSDVSWVLAADNLGSYNSANYAGVQVGNKNNAGSFTLTSSTEWGDESFPAATKGKTKITQVRLWLNTGGSPVTPSVTIGDKAATSDGATVVKNSSAASYSDATKVTFTPATGGEYGTVVINIETEKAGYVCAIEIDCEEGVVPDVAKPVISGETSFYKKTHVTITCSTEGATVWYTTNGEDPDLADEDTNEVPAAGFDIDATATVKAIAVKGTGLDTKYSSIATKEFTKATVMTVTQALDSLDKVSTIANAYVKGIISQVDSYNETYGSITYWISDDGTTANQLEVYGGLGLDGAQFVTENALQKGDKVTVFGSLKIYKSTKEFDKDNILVEFEEGTPTAIDNTAVDAKVVKTIENGQLVIIKNGVKYNAQGTQIR